MAEVRTDPTGTFAMTVEECRLILERLTERVDDHLGFGPDEILWGHVADADRVLYHLRHAAIVAGLGEEPAS